MPIAGRRGAGALHRELTTGRITCNQIESLAAQDTAVSTDKRPLALPTRSVAKQNKSQQSIAQRFLADTAHLDPEQRMRVLELIRKASLARDSGGAGSKLTPIKRRN
jgi:hypothetical protein